ncbi:MAG TPA: helix-turn-helix domain-containing protein [Lysobacter sp.]
MVDLCQAAGVSERTLRTIIHEQFDLGPSRYLRLRRLQMLHAALSHADPGGNTVASVAARFGYAHGGRMASEYQTLFGEYPSQTLGREFAGPGMPGERSADALFASGLDQESTTGIRTHDGGAAWRSPGSPASLHGRKHR